MSRVTCHMSLVTCHMSHVKCNFLSSFFWAKGLGYSVEGPLSAGPTPSSLYRIASRIYSKILLNEPPLPVPPYTIWSFVKQFSLLSQVSESKENQMGSVRSGASPIEFQKPWNVSTAGFCWTNHWQVSMILHFYKRSGDWLFSQWQISYFQGV